MSIEHRRGTPDLPGIIELDPAPPTKNLRLRITEAVITDGEPTLKGPPLDELIDRLEQIEVSEDIENVRLYLDELRNMREREISENNQAVGIWEKLKKLSHEPRQIIIDGHPVGGRTTAVVAGVLTSVVGAGIFMKLAHRQPRPSSTEQDKK